MLLLSIACGTKVGNPKQPDPDTANEQNIELPDIDFVIDESLVASDTKLSLTAAFGMVQKRLLRASGLVVEFKKVMDILENNSISELRNYEIEVNDTSIGIDISASSEEEFDYNMILSASDSVIMSVRWKRGNSKVQINQTFSLYPFNDQVNKSRSSMINYEFDGDNAKLDFLIQGTGYLADSLIGAEDFLTEYAELQRDQSGNIILKSVGDWHTSSEKDGPFSGDLYLVANLILDGDKNFIGYYNDLRACGSFSEVELEGFCFSGVLGRLRVDYNASTLNTRVGELSPLGIVSKNKLEPVPLPSR